ncbi:hypothetical protein CsSME_00052832 [Camellia sinensis var. sinensis]
MGRSVDGGLRFKRGVFEGIRSCLWSLSRHGCCGFDINLINSETKALAKETRIVEDNFTEFR